MHARIFFGYCVLLLATAGYAQTSAPASALLSIPETSAQSRARELLHKLFAKEFAKTAPADRSALAKTLLAQAIDTKDDPVVRYVALTESNELAWAAGDATTALAGVTELARFYVVDVLELRRHSLLRCLPNTTSAADAQAVMQLALDTADQAAAVDAFDAVVDLANLAESAANKTRQVRIVASIQTHLSELRALTTEFVQVRTAFAHLDENPLDADAHLTIGRFYGLHKGLWTLALPHLVKCSDEKLRNLAERELAQSADETSQLQLGDAWWDYAQASAGVERRNAARHASDLYRGAQKTLQGITLKRIESRIDSAAATPAASVVQTPVANTINLLALIDPARDVDQGKWHLAAGGLVCESSAYATLAIPYTPPEEFDLRVTFTRTQGAGPLAVLLATHNRNFDFILDMKGEARFERVAGKIAKDNPTVAPVLLVNGQRYTLTLQIRSDSIRALLDGRLLTEHKTDYKDLTRYSTWKFPNDKLCTLGANNAAISFHSLELIEISDKGKPTR